MPVNITPGDFHKRERLYQQLAQMLTAGMSIINVLEILARKPPGNADRKPLQRVVQDLKQGATVSEAWSNQRGWMPQFDNALIRSGEKSGRLDAVFRLLSKYYLERAAITRQVWSDLAYPIFVLHFAVLIFPIVNWIAGKASAVSVLVHFVAFFGPIYAIAIGLIVLCQGKRGEFWRSLLERICNLIPVISSARQALAIARLSTALEALLNSGTNIIESWEMAAAASGSPRMYRAVLSWRPYLDEGQTPGQMVNSMPRVFPEVFANLYATGEVSGQLDDSLVRLHTYYQEESSHKLKQLAIWLPRMFYIGTLLYVAYLIVSSYQNSDYMKTLNELSK